MVCLQVVIPFSVLKRENWRFCARRSSAHGCRFGNLGWFSESSDNALSEILQRECWHLPPLIGKTGLEISFFLIKNDVTSDVIYDVLYMSENFFTLKPNAQFKHLSWRCVVGEVCILYGLGEHSSLILHPKSVYPYLYMYLTGICLKTGVLEIQLPDIAETWNYVHMFRHHGRHGKKILEWNQPCDHTFLGGWKWPFWLFVTI